MKQIEFFAGVGGFGIGAKRQGIETVACIEIDTWNQEILRQLHPNALILGDINGIEQTLPFAQIFTGGFPCQDISNSNPKGLGTNGTRSGLFRKFIEFVSIYRPQYVVMENVSKLTTRGLEYVLLELAKIGYDAEWNTLQASYFGFPHQRERLFIVAYPNGIGLQNMVLKPPKDYRLLGEFAPSETYQSFANRWNDRYEHKGDLPRVDGFKRIEKFVKAAGNAVMPCMTSYIFSQIKQHYELHQASTQLLCSEITS